MTNKVLVRRIRATTRVAGICATDDEEGVDEEDDTDPNGPSGDGAAANGERMKEKNKRAADHHKREVARDQGEQEPTQATAGSPLAPSLADGASVRPGSGIQTSTTSAKTTNVPASKR